MHEELVGLDRTRTDWFWIQIRVAEQNLYANTTTTTPCKQYSKHDPRWKKDLESYEAFNARMSARKAPWNPNDDPYAFD